MLRPLKGFETITGFKVNGGVISVFILVHSPKVISRKGKIMGEGKVINK